MIKAIQTCYQGYRFRSRLEARYAVFMDTVGIKWEYEKEGFHLPSGSYLPDFWLPKLECWLEIKPELPTDLETKLCEELAWGTDKAVAVCFGIPGDNPIHVYCSDTSDSSAGTQWWDEVQWAIDEKTGAAVFCSGSWSHDFFSPNFSSFAGMRLAGDCILPMNLLQAFRKAKSARFEHGETPR